MYRGARDVCQRAQVQPGERDGESAPDRRAGLPVPAQGRPAGGGGVQGGVAAAATKDTATRNCLGGLDETISAFVDPVTKLSPPEQGENQFTEAKNKLSELLRRPSDSGAISSDETFKAEPIRLEDKQVPEDVADHLRPHESCGSVSIQLRTRTRYEMQITSSIWKIILLWSSVWMACNVFAPHCDLGMHDYFYILFHTTFFKFN
jgi:hypothetical protein